MVEMTLFGDLPAGARVGLDSAPVIYLIEQAPRYLTLVEGLFYERLDTGLNQAVTSVVTLSEVHLVRLGATAHRPCQPPTDV